MLPLPGMQTLATHSEAPTTGTDTTSAQWAPAAAAWLGRMLDESDYGMLLLDAQGRLLHANHAARNACAGSHPLQLVADRLQTRRREDAALLDEALQGARRGRRTLLALGEAGQPVHVSVIPLQAEGSRATLLMMSRRQICEPLSLQGFARCHALTPAEARLLEGLCAGQEPRALAQQHGVSLSTVRTQICSIRSKTGARNTRELLRQLSTLPPMISSLRGL
jgi:DNA-binding CsgD family transcriptional regulator